ncbi:16S rRNA (guanine(527)-N(7))-methyltransferase RsmG [uncultured Ilyobacter sp.]|uniref:16S rRNA (guanine(527)-N(7))-methyltransferase RsmG n=1 Tax=uncultured Ilyobacter sp. TaxID=544433 RepID=UPI0029C0554A|nr:16S rRNA (guanine(527)-N(7))-methyltransferase RsmG [uncultured Ilyobacter sp.]
MREYLLKGIESLGLGFDGVIVDNLMAYAKLLLETNKHTNLTAIRDEDSLIEKHFIDSMLLHKLISENTENAIDIGTGAGFPGMVLAICNPKIKFTLMDSVGKKTDFLEMVKNELGLENVEVVNDRAEEYIKNGKRETYDLGLCRGVSKLNVILEYMIPFLKVDGVFLAQKMEGTGEENESQNALNTLDSEIEEIYKLELPFCKDSRTIIKIRKNKATDGKYPRRTGIPLKRPL